jgi:hypothetical protein
MKNPLFVQKKKIEHAMHGMGLWHKKKGESDIHMHMLMSHDLIDLVFYG